MLRSPHAAATITGIDTAAAKALPGVRAIYTSADLNADGIGGLPCAVALKNRDGSDMPMPPHPVLADGVVRHVGDPVAFIVAETQQAARDAAEAIDGRLRHPALRDRPRRPRSDAGQPLVWPEVRATIVCSTGRSATRTETDALFAQAAQGRQPDGGEQPHRRELDGAARGDRRRSMRRTGRWTLHANTQGGWLVKDLLAKAVFKHRARAVPRRSRPTSAAASA